MATKELTRVGKPENLQDRAMTMALAILFERIRSLPKEDKNDLYELMKEIPSAETDEDLEEIVVGMNEILDQDPVVVNQMGCDEDTPKGLARWMGYVGDKIRVLREGRRMTQNELAHKSGLPQSHISRLEAGKHSPSRRTLEKIATGLGVNVRDLDISED